MSSVPESVEVLIRALGLPYRKHEGSILIEYEDSKFGKLGLVVSYEESSDTIRIAVPLDVEPFQEALKVLLEENFSSSTYKYALDYDGFIVVIYDIPRKCVSSARDIREALLEVLSGAKRILERSESAAEGAEREAEHPS